jgi:predicted DNA-binding ribbon-helix-helix protein
LNDPALRHRVPVESYTAILEQNIFWRRFIARSEELVIVALVDFKQHFHGREKNITNGIREQTTNMKSWLKLNGAADSKKTATIRVD